MHAEIKKISSVPKYHYKNEYFTLCKIMIIMISRERYIKIMNK